MNEKSNDQYERGGQDPKISQRRVSKNDRRAKNENEFCFTLSVSSSLRNYNTNENNNENDEIHHERRESANNKDKNVSSSGSTQEVSSYSKFKPRDSPEEMKESLRNSPENKFRISSGEKNEHIEESIGQDISVEMTIPVNHEYENTYKIFSLHSSISSLRHSQSKYIRELSLTQQTPMLSPAGQVGNVFFRKDSKNLINTERNLSLNLASIQNSQRSSMVSPQELKNQERQIPENKIKNSKSRSSSNLLEKNVKLFEENVKETLENEVEKVNCKKQDMKINEKTKANREKGIKIVSN